MALLRLVRRRRERSDGRTNCGRPGNPSLRPAELSLTSLPLPGNDELRLADEPGQPPEGRRTRMGSDPYSSDGGFARPHAWERVERD